MLEFLHSFGLPQNLSIQGEYIDNANVLMHWLMLYLFLGWGVFFIVSLYKFRASRNKKADYYGVKSHLSSVLEGAVAIIEIIALFGFSYPVWAYRVNDVPDSRDAVNIRVIAQQFAWNIHYPGADGKFGNTRVELVDEETNPIGLDRDGYGADDITTINQLHLPVDKNIKLYISSKDVIHGFSLPEMRLKQDAIPGMQVPIYFKATMTSEEFLAKLEGTAREGMGYEIACAQLCGNSHYRMKGYMTVHKEEDYNNWLIEEAEYIDSGDEDDWDDEW